MIIDGKEIKLKAFDLDGNEIIDDKLQHFLDNLQPSNLSSELSINEAAIKEFKEKFHQNKYQIKNLNRYIKIDVRKR